MVIHLFNSPIVFFLRNDKSIAIIALKKSRSNIAGSARPKDKKERKKEQQKKTEKTSDKAVLYAFRDGRHNDPPPFIPH